MDFAPDEKTEFLINQVQEFMDEHIYPNEQAYYEEHASLPDRWQSPPMLEDLKDKARAAGLWNLFLPESESGGGLTNLQYASLCELMGRVGFAAAEQMAEIPSRSRQFVYVMIFFTLFFQMM